MSAEERKMIEERLAALARRKDTDQTAWIIVFFLSCISAALSISQLFVR